jgi:methyl-accepting chemotaxis protein
MDFFENLNIRWKVIIITMIGPILMAVIFTWQHIGAIKNGSEDSIISESKALVLMAESIRNQMGMKIDKGLIKPFDQIDKNNILEVVPVISAIKAIEESIGKEDQEFRVPKIDPRNPKNEPTELERQVLKEFEDKDLPEKIIIERDKIRYFRPIKLTKECLFCHGEGDKDVLGYKKEGWKEGEVHGAFEIISSLKETNKAIVKAETTSAIFAIFILTAICLVAWSLLKLNLLTPLNLCSNLIKVISEGDLTQNLNLKSKDEFAGIVSDLNNMVVNLRQILKDITETANNLSGSSRKLNATSADVATGADKTVRLSQSVATAAEEMSSNMTSVAAAAEETSTSVDLVSTAAEELKSAIREIAEKSERARIITNKGVSQSQSASEKVITLEQAVMEINKITETITEISDQINLLALNATIEAARAGEAGKGFAVVANEVKELSRQTAHATDDIRTKIDDIQESAQLTMSELKEVSKIIEEINQIVYTVASAVEEQSVTTDEIASTIANGAQGIQEISTNIAQSSQVANEIAQDISEVNNSMELLAGSSSSLKNHSEELNNIGEQLRRLVQKFRI